MATIITKPSGTNGSGNGAFPQGGGDGTPFSRVDTFDTASLGMFLGLAGISMLFIALTSSYVVREGFDPGWEAIRMPALLPVNTIVLLVSSVTMGRAQRAADAVLASRWLKLTLLLGLVFLAGQALVWRQLSAAGIYLSTSAHGSFVYLLSALHGLHILGGIVVVNWALLKKPEGLSRVVRVAAIYWHFMDGLWVYLLALLFVWR